MRPDRLFDDMFDLGQRPPKDKMECDIYEEDGKYFIEATVAGFDKEDIKVEAEDGSIIITATKNEDEKSNDKNE